MTLSSLNPANGMLLGSYEALTPEALTSKIADAHEAFSRYCETTLEERAMWMKKLAGILEQEMEELATLLATETGKTITACREEVLRGAACCRYYAENAASLLADEAAGRDTDECATTWQPLGVLITAMPSTNVFSQALQFVVPALLGGNVVLMKHCVGFPQCATEMELLLRRAGFSRGVFQRLLIHDTDLKKALDDERIVGVWMSGGRDSTRDIAAHAMWMGKRVTVENDRSSVMIVMPSANLFAAIQAGVRSRCLDNGQSSASTAYFFVQEDVYDDFTMLFTAAMEDVKIGNPLKDETELGPLATEEQVRRSQAQVARARESGGRTLTGGESMLGDGNYLEPTVIVDLPPQYVANGESFEGPVALLFRVASADAAIALANDAKPGKVSVWTQDVAEQKQFSRRLVAGGIYLNAPIVNDGGPGTGSARSTARARVHEFMSASTVVRMEMIPGEDFNFELALDGFDEESVAAGVDPMEQVARVEAQVYQAVIEDDLLDEVEASLASADAGRESAGAVAVMEATSVSTDTSRRWRPLVTAAEESTGAAHPPSKTEPCLKTEAEDAVPPANHSFKEMFERALQVRA